MKRILLYLAVLPAFVQAQNLLQIPDTLSGPNINLTLQQGTVNFFAGAATQTFGVNGNLLGPTLILTKNQQVTINVNNQLPDTTTIHWHGMHVAPQHDGGPHITIAPNTIWSPSFTVLDAAATHWYHPHLHMHTNEHVQKGIAGLIIVRDSVERALALPRTYGVDDIPLVIQTKAFTAGNQIIIKSASDTTLLVNGTRNAYKPVPAQMVRFRLLNGSSERVYNIGFTNNRTFYQIGTDGGLLAAPVALTRVRLAPGERAEIVVDLAGLQGQTLALRNFGSELPNAIYGATQPGMGMGQSIPGYTQNPLNGGNYDILSLNVIAPTANAITSLPSSLTTHTPWSENQAQITRTLTFSPQTMGGPNMIMGPFLINMMPFDMMMINYHIPFNNIEIWELRNQTPISHPFHIHNVQFYILDINGAAPPANLQGKKDVVLVPAGNGVVRFITKFEDHFNDTVPYMYHCHMLTHEDEGMMGQFLVTSPGFGVNESKVRNTAVTVYPNPAADLLQITSAEPWQKVEIIDVNGRVVQVFAAQHEQLHIGALPAGVYVVKVFFKDGVGVQRVVKR